VSRMSSADRDSTVAVLNVDTIASNKRASPSEDLDIGIAGPDTLRPGLAVAVVDSIRHAIPGLGIKVGSLLPGQMASSDWESFRPASSPDLTAILDFSEKNVPEFLADPSYLHGSVDNAERIDWSRDGFYIKGARAVVAAATVAAEVKL
jgi:hypothetical protein